MPEPEPKKKGGWKSKLGGILKALGGVVLGFVIEQLIPQLLRDGNSLPPGVVGGSFATLVVGDALQRYGLAHKQERTIEAIEKNRP
jgi:hypothetical protein